MCSHQFLLEVVNNKKKVMNIKDLDRRNVRGADKLSVNKVIEHAVNHIPSLGSYLPQNPLRHCTREFLFTLIHSLDCNYLPRVVEQEEEKQMAKRKKKTAEKQIAVNSLIFQ